MMTFEQIIAAESEMFNKDIIVIDKALLKHNVRVIVYEAESRIVAKYRGESGQIMIQRRVVTYAGDKAISSGIISTEIKER